MIYRRIYSTELGRSLRKNTPSGTINEIWRFTGYNNWITL
jgi:hypothetical protein